MTLPLCRHCDTTALSRLRWALAGCGAISDMSPTGGEKPRAVRGLGGESVELFSRSEALVSGLNHHLSFRECGWG